MRFMILVKAAEDAPPLPPAVFEALARAREEAMRAGTLIETGGLAPTARSSRVRLSGGRVSVTDGPFTEAKEVIGGYAVVEAASKEEAVAGAVWLMELHREHCPDWEGEVDVRPILGTGDFGPDVTPLTRG